VCLPDREVYRVDWRVNCVGQSRRWGTGRDENEQRGVARSLCGAAGALGSAWLRPPTRHADANAVVA